MTTNQPMRWFLKPAVFLACLIPLAHLLWDLFTNNLSANPIDEITDRTGIWTIRFILIALAVTPIRQLCRQLWLTKCRRMVGLFAFFYASLHFMTYVVVDQFFSWDDIIQDIMKRPYITVGFTGFVLLVPLTVTSTAKMIKRLGKRWLQLHRLVYAIGILGVIHYLWQVKADISSPAKYGAILAVLLGYRAWAMLDKRRRLGLRGIWPQTKQPLQASRKST